jgi:Flp pilus assembly protein TadG
MLKHSRLAQSKRDTSYAMGGFINLVAFGQRRNRASRGQALVEFAIIAPIALFLMLVGIQFAIIGTASLGLGQVDYQGARYAATNTSASQSAVQSYMVSVASPIIAAGSGQYLTSTLSPAPPCTFGSTVTVAVTFDISHLVVLPNPFFGISFPTSLTNSASAFCEG